MTSANGQKSLVVLQLYGGNDTLNTVVPYADPLYYDLRPNVRIEEDAVLKIDDYLGLNSNLAPIKELWDEEKLAIINGIGYPNPNRSHFRSVDIWHTAQPDKLRQEGWLGCAIRDLDPKGENVVTAVNFGRGLPRALAAKGVSVASVGNLETYGLFRDLEDEAARELALEAFAQMYGGAEGKGPLKEFLGQTGSDALRGADILRTAPEKYSSSVEYGPSPVAQSLRNVAQVMFADLGTRIYYTTYGNFDTHAGELPSHAKLWQDTAEAIGDFVDDLEEHAHGDDTAILVFSEFGRRLKDNGSGTDHGSGGSAFVIGGQVKGGLYGDYPSLREEDQLDGDLQFNNDFRSTYSTLLEQWLGLDPVEAVNGTFEQLDFFRR